MKIRQFTFQSELPVSLEDAFSWHLRKGALERFLPPWSNVSLLFPPATPDQEGGEVGFRLRCGPFSIQWILEHREFIPDQEFSDVQVKGPFRQYRHRHHFEPSDPLSCKLTDEVAFATPFSIMDRRIEKEFTRMFAWRHALLSDDLRTWDLYPREPQRILLSGASGFIGSSLKNFLQLCGHKVVRLVRRRDDVAEDSIFWDPSNGNFEKEHFEGFDAVIHLAGANLSQGRWSEKNKEQFFLSRCRDTWLLSQVLCRLYRPPKTVIAASAIGYYGNRGREILTESSSQGQGFLADLCAKWEKATDSIENRGARVVHARFGAVLGAKGGMLQKILPIFKWGLGGKLGTGQQMISWIGIDDLIGGIYHTLMKDSLSGPVNLVAPQPLSQAEFSRILAHKLKRPAFCNVPAWALKAVLGEMAEEMLLASQNVQPQKLLESGYEFRYPDLSKALDFVI